MFCIITKLYHEEEKQFFPRQGGHVIGYSNKKKDDRKEAEWLRGGEMWKFLLVLHGRVLKLSFFLATLG